MNLLPLAPPDPDTKNQGFIASTQTPLGMISEQIVNISWASMAPVEVKAIRKTDPMVILGEKGRSSRNLLIRSEPYDTVQQRTILPIQKMKSAKMEMRNNKMVRMPNRGGDEEVRIINPDSLSRIYFTESVKAQFRLIAQNRKMKEVDNIKNKKVNDLKRSAPINQRTRSFAKLVVNLPNEMMAYEENYTPLLQVLLSLSTDIIKNSY